MKKFVAVFLFAFVSSAYSFGQNFQQCVTNTAFHFLNPKTFDFTTLEPLPPQEDKVFHDYELQELLRLQNSRTQQELQQANTDAAELDIFIFKAVVGGQFDATNPALKATIKLSQDLCEEANALVTVQKKKFMRKRPFLTDTALKPGTDVSGLDSPSYPSGHSLIGTLEALALSDMIPGKRDAIMMRAREFGHERNILGVHYLSDVVAGRTVAYALYNELSKSPKFKQELDAARAEVKAQFPNP